MRKGLYQLGVRREAFLPCLGSGLFLMKGSRLVTYESTTKRSDFANSSFLIPHSNERVFECNTYTTTSFP